MGKERVWRNHRPTLSTLHARRLNKEFRNMIKEPHNDFAYTNSAVWHRMEVPAGTILIKEGEIARKVFLVEKGCLRAWVNSQGREITFQFFFENEAASVLESLRRNIPSFLTLETIEPSTILWIHKKDWETLTQQISDIPGMKDRGIDSLLDRYYQYIRQFVSYLKESPEERYLNLIKEKPEILTRVPLQHIATYLGVTPVSLSRIRSRISRKKKV